ncbi:hypothetical protein D3C85_693480 [compost metagenome]
MRNIPELNKSRHFALIQWRALNEVCRAQEERLKVYQNKIKELEKKLAKTSQSEIDALYAENERLTNLLLELENK